MGLIMDTGSVVNQLDKMNQNLIEKSFILIEYEREIDHFIQAKDQLTSEAYDGLRNRYELIHKPIIAGLKQLFQEHISENNRYKGYIVGTLGWFLYR